MEDKKQISNNIVGHWVNEDCKTLGIIGYTIEINGNKLQFKIYGKCHPSWSESSFETEKFHEKGFNLICEYSYKKEEVEGVLENGKLNILEKVVYTDNSGREPREAKDLYYKLDDAANFESLSKVLKDTFYSAENEYS
jgi:hypothetical protein